MRADELSPGAQHLLVLVMVELTAFGNTVEKQCLIETAGKPLGANIGEKKSK